MDLGISRRGAWLPALVLALASFLAGELFALAKAPPASAGGTCRIEVTTFRRSRKSSRRVFKIPAADEADCRAAARLHEENFNPAQISRISVQSRFTPGAAR